MRGNALWLWLTLLRQWSLACLPVRKRIGGTIGRFVNRKRSILDVNNPVRKWHYANIVGYGQYHAAVAVRDLRRLKLVPSYPEPACTSSSRKVHS